MKGLISIMLVVCIVASLATVGVFVYTEVIYERPVPDDYEEFEKMKQESANVTTAIQKSLKLERMTINLLSRRTRLRFLDTRIHLVPFKSENIPILEENKAIIKNTIIEIVSKLKPEQLNSVSGKILLAEKIKKQVNQSLNKKILKEIYFAHFVVQ